MENEKHEEKMSAWHKDYWARHKNVEDKLIWSCHFKLIRDLLYTTLMYGSENHFLTSILLKCIDTAVTCIEHAELVHEGKIAEDIKDYLDKFEELVLKEEREKGIRHTDALQKLKDKILERINYCINERWNNL